MHVQLHNHICQLEDVFEHIGTWYDNMSLYMYIYCFIMFYHQYHGSSGGAKQVALQTRGGLRQAGSLPFSCYYWTLILVAAASAEHGSKWSHFFCRFKRFAVSCHFLRTASFPLLSGAGRFRSFPPPGRMSKLTISRFVRNQMLVAVNGDISIYTLYITLGYIKELIQGSLSLIYVWTGSLVQT